MDIDNHFVTLAERRGLSRGRLGALIRIIEENDEYTFAQSESIWAIQKGISSSQFYMHRFNLGPDKCIYDIPIAKDISFREHRSGGVKDNYGQIMWDWTVLVHLKDRKFPVTAMSAFEGKSLRAVIDHPDLPGDRIIKTIGEVPDGTVLVLEPDKIEPDVDLPARHYRQELEKKRLRLECRKDCIAAHAIVGLSVRSGSYIIATICLLTGLCASLINGWPPIATGGFISASIVSACLSAKYWFRLDSYLENRVVRYREDLLAQKYQEICAGSAKQRAG